MRLRTRLLLTYSPVPLLLIAILGLALWSWSLSDQRANQTYEKANQTILASESIQRLAREMDSVEFDYTTRYPFLNHNPETAMARFEQDRRDFDQFFNQLDATTDNPKERELLADIARHTASFLSVDRRMQTLVRQGRLLEAERLNFTASEVAYDALSEAIRKLINYNRSLYEQTIQRAAAQRSATRWLSLAGGLAVFLFSLAIGQFLAVSIARPVTELERGAERLRRGDFDLPATSSSVQGISELRSLFDTLVEMARSLSKLTGDLKDANVDLEAQVARRTAELDRAMQELERKVDELRSLDRLKNSFVSTVSHELRTPLTSIMGYAEFLEDEVGGELTDPQRAFVEQIQIGARRLARIVDDLLDFARLESGTFKLTRQPLNLCGLVRDEVASLVPQARETRVELDLPADCSQPLWVEADQGRIGQVLINLVNNAIKFTRPGGSVSVSITRDGDRAKVEVVDTGIGIPPQELDHVFEKFYQVQQSNTRERGGTGLGLTISKALVEAHGGAIGASSRPGQGSTFWFELPLKSMDGASGREAS